MPRFFSVIVAVGFFLGATATAQAAPITYDFNGNFDAPATGSFSGSFTFDSITGDISAGTVNVTQGLAKDGVALLPAHTVTYTVQPKTHKIVLTEAMPAKGFIGGWVYVSPTPPGPPSPQISQYLSGKCYSDDCFTITLADSERRIASSVIYTVNQPPASVPTLSEWAMILLGMVMAGGAALTIRRRRICLP